MEAAIKHSRKGGTIESETEEKVAGILAILGLLSGLLAAMNQLIRLWQWRGEEPKNEEISDLAEDLDVLEARLNALDAEVERLEAEKDCQD